MTPIEIVRKDTQSTVGYACGKCGSMWTDKMFGGAENSGKEQAARCCVPNVCEKHGEYRGFCARCSSADRVAKEQKRFENATKVPLAEYGGEMLYLEQNEKFYDPSDLDDVELDELDRPAYAWACEAEGVSWSVDEALRDHVYDNHHEDAYEWVDGTLIEEAQALVDKACAKVRSMLIRLSHQRDAASLTRCPNGSHRRKNLAPRSFPRNTRGATTLSSSAN